MAGCASVPIRHFADPGEFARNLFSIAERDAAREWGTQLTMERQAMDDPYLSSHFERWKGSMLELKPAFGVPLEQVPFRVSDDSALEFQVDGKWHLLLRVKMENGGWKINQD